MIGVIQRAAIGAALAVGATMPAAAQQPAQQGIRLNFNVTPAGQAVMKRYMGTPDPRAKALADQANAVAQRQRALIAAPKLNLAQFAAGLRQQEALRAQITKLANERMIKMLGELSEADRVGFLRGLANPIPASAPKK